MSTRYRYVWLVAVVLLYLGLATHQLGLPGLHYDEAKEAGVNAMELVTGAPVTAFRGATANFGRVQVPLMVQDYIGALNVFLAVPLLALTGIGVPNLRYLAVVTGLLALLTLERSVTAWWRIHKPGRGLGIRTPSLAGLATMTLLAASPTFVFWSRQGIFVTNLTLPLSYFAIWQSLRWWQTGKASALLLAALGAGLALYAKLLAIWLIGPLMSVLALVWLVRTYQRKRAPRLTWPLFWGTGLVFLLPLVPLLLFNLQTGGTWQSVGSNLSESYYGVNNLALGNNIRIRVAQIGQVLRGDQFWYLGGIFGNGLAPWLAAAAVVAGLIGRPRVVSPPVLFAVTACAMSLFTVSDLFVTHYALLHPLFVAIPALGVAVFLDEGKGVLVNLTRKWALGSVVLLWLVLDLVATFRYHGALTTSGGLADHSDASYHLAYHMRYSGLGAPIALDWGLDAPVRYLTEGTVTPIEIFGYEATSAPDAEFAERVRSFLNNPDNVYLLHDPEHTVFRGRREIFLAEADRAGLTPKREAIFSQRDGIPIYELWRVEP